MSHQLTSKTQVLQFILGGNATITTVSPKTQKRLTFKIKSHDGAAPPNRMFFVSLLNGPDNEEDYVFLGTLRVHGVPASMSYTPGKKSRVTVDADSQQFWLWFAAWAGHDSDRVMRMNYYHEGRSGRCNRKLTVPESIESGFGPECAGRV